MPSQITLPLAMERGARARKELPIAFENYMRNVIASIQTRNSSFKPSLAFCTKILSQFELSPAQLNQYAQTTYVALRS